MWKKYSLVIHPCIFFLLTSSLEKDIKRHMSWISRSSRRSVLCPGPMLFDLRMIQELSGYSQVPLLTEQWLLSLPSDEGWVDFYWSAFLFIQQTRSYWLWQNSSPFTPVCSISSGLGCSDMRDKLVLLCGCSWTVNLSRAPFVTALPHPLADLD